MLSLSVTWHFLLKLGFKSKGYPLNSKLNKINTSALLSGGWVPGISRRFHYWQPAPRLNNVHIAGQPYNPPTKKMAWSSSSHTGNLNQAGTHYPKISMEKKTKREGMGRNSKIKKCHAPPWRTRLVMLVWETPQERCTVLTTGHVPVNQPITASKTGALCC